MQNSFVKLLSSQCDRAPCNVTLRAGSVALDGTARRLAPWQLPPASARSYETPARARATWAVARTAKREPRARVPHACRLWQGKLHAWIQSHGERRRERVLGMCVVTDGRGMHGPRRKLRQRTKRRGHSRSRSHSRTGGWMISFRRTALVACSLTHDTWALIEPENIHADEPVPVAYLVNPDPLRYHKSLRVLQCYCSNRKHSYSCFTVVITVAIALTL